MIIITNASVLYTKFLHFVSICRTNLCLSKSQHVTKLTVFYNYFFLPQQTTCFLRDCLKTTLLCTFFYLLRQVGRLILNNVHIYL